MNPKKLLLATALSLTVGSAALASPVLTDLTANDYIVFNGLKWAAASPVTSQYFSGYNELFQASLHQGWREATDLEWALRPTWTDFGGKCASQYWNSAFAHCDIGDDVSQHWIAGSDDYRDLWYVSGAQAAAPAAVPEPASLALFAAGLFGAAALRRKASGGRG